MKHQTAFAAAFALAVLAIPFAAQAEGLLADDKGMTLYVFDKDVGGVPSCYDTCAAKWPPYLGAADAKMAEGWTLVDRTDGTKQWAYDGKPVYFFAGDMKAGDAMGDGLGEVWHVIKE
jgi:predicted lipoprotein with Yx(FWY)xxD motif